MVDLNMVPESVAVEYLDKVWRTKEKERDWRRVDMDWFSAVLLKSTEHHKQRAINDERDPAQACRRIQKKEGHHSKFGPPFMSPLSRGRSIIAAHDVAFIIANPTCAKFITLITCLPKKKRLTFNEFIKRQQFKEPPVRVRAFRKQARTHLKTKKAAEDRTLKVYK